MVITSGLQLSGTRGVLPPPLSHSHACNCDCFVKTTLKFQRHYVISPWVSDEQSQSVGISVFDLSLHI